MDNIKKIEQVVPSDDNDLSQPAHALYSPTGGAVAVKLINDTEAVVLQLQPHQFTRVSVQRVLATGTTATDILALYRYVKAPPSNRSDSPFQFASDWWPPLTVAEQAAQ